MDILVLYASRHFCCSMSILHSISYKAKSLNHPDIITEPSRYYYCSIGALFAFSGSYMYTKRRAATIQ